MGGESKVNHFYRQCHTSTHLLQHFLFIVDLYIFFLFGRRDSLERILPRAQLFQEGVDNLQHWLISVEQALTELRNAERVMLHPSEAIVRAKVGNVDLFHKLYFLLGKGELDVQSFFFRHSLMRFRLKLLSLQKFKKQVKSSWK